MHNVSTIIVSTDEMLFYQAAEEVPHRYSFLLPKAPVFKTHYLGERPTPSPWFLQKHWSYAALGDCQVRCQLS